MRNLSSLVAVMALSFSGLAVTTFFPSSFAMAQLSKEDAPKGSYSAILGNSVTSQRTIGEKRGATRRTRTTDAASGGNVQISITSYSPQSELEAAAQAGQGNLVTTIGGFNHGSVTLNGQSYPINLATSFRSGDNYRINLVSAKPFTQTGAQGGVGKAVAVGYITLLVPVAGGQGTGSLYTATGATISASGDVQPSAGRIGGTATQLTAVTR